MIPEMFKRKLDRLLADYDALIYRHNPIVHGGNGLLNRFLNPVLTAEHTPVFWRYDLDPRTNPHLMVRLGINSASNPGAIELGGTIYLMARVEGVDRKSFFAIAESKSGRRKYSKLLKADLSHSIEKVGAQLRARMPWLQSGRA